MVQRFRLSTPVVVIGFIFLIPSLFGMTASGLLFLAVMTNANLPTFLLSAPFVIGIGVSSFVGGLFGYLLTMKKRVLQCNECGATVSAS
ncbi:MAG TPA: hypothetical protein VKW78_09120 [Terriglobales bacterium]|nr:hypothetical protein [Terriglobales bacterium]